VSGVDFQVETAPPRAGDPARIVAQSAQIRKKLHWQPRYDDLSTIVEHALAWERELTRRRAAHDTGRVQFRRA
jgi:UDP-glucose 4-epimerase